MCFDGKCRLGEKLAKVKSRTTQMMDLILVHFWDATVLYIISTTTTRKGSESNFLYPRFSVCVALV